MLIKGSTLFFNLNTDAKRLIGRRFDDSNVTSDMKHWPFKVINEGGKPKLQVLYKGETKTFYPEEISSMVLTKMKETAEAYLGQVCVLIVAHSRFFCGYHVRLCNHRTDGY